MNGYRDPVVCEIATRNKAAKTELSTFGPTHNEDVSDWKPEENQSGLS